MKDVSCNKCGKQFALDAAQIRSIENGDLAIQYFSCPHCGEKFHVFTSDSQMRRLISQRNEALAKIRISYAKNFSAKTQKKYLDDYERIKREQENLLPILRSKGEGVLRAME